MHGEVDVDGNHGMCTKAFCMKIGIVSHQI